MKPIQKNKNSGFTLIELLVVIAILGMMSTLVLVNFNRLRSQRSVILAENEMVSQIRKVQNYALSGHDPSTSGNSSRYFVLTFQSGTSAYSISSVEYNNGTYSYNNLETVNMNEGASIKQLAIVNDPSRPVCLQLIFSVPYGRTYIYSSTTSCGNAITTILSDPLQLAALANRTGTIDIQNTQAATVKRVTVLGVTGRVEGN